MVQTTDGKYHKLTDVYAAYGVQEALETINRNFDLNITEYVTVNWYAVAETIDLMGGLDIAVSYTHLIDVELGTETFWIVKQDKYKV